MSDQHLIDLDELCNYYQIEHTFIESLSENGLISTTTVSQKIFLDHSHLRELEKYIRLHNDLDINVEGIGAITHLLNTINEMQEEISALKNRLKLTEP